MWVIGFKILNWICADSSLDVDVEDNFSFFNYIKKIFT